MAEVLARYSDSLAIDGISYVAQACGAADTRGLWEGWIEFIAVDAVENGRVLRTGRETTQPNRVDALYWASGLTRTYLEGALDRAAHHIERIKVPSSEPVFNEPAPHTVHTSHPEDGDA